MKTNKKDLINHIEAELGVTPEQKYTWKDWLYIAPALALLIFIIAYAVVSIF